MSEPILYATFYLLLAIAQLIVAAIIYLSNRKALTNRVLTFYFVLFAISNIAIGNQLTAFSLSEAEPWLWLRLAFGRLNAPLFFLISILVLRPAWLQKRWLSLPLAALVVIPPIGVLLDITGLSMTLFGDSLLYQAPASAAYSGGYIALEEYGGGLLNGIYSSGQILFPALAMIFPGLYVALRDRRRSPGTSQLALVIFVAASVPAIVLIGLQSETPILGVAIANLVLTGGFAYIGLQEEGAPFTVRRMTQIMADWPMFSKLMALVVVVILPATLITGLTALTFLQATLVELVGTNLNTLAEAEARNVGSELERQIENLLSLAQDPRTEEVVTERNLSYLGIGQDVLAESLEDREEFWQIISDTSPRVREILDDSRNSHLVSFTEIFKTHESLVVTDRAGGLVTATERTEHYNYSQTEWFEKSYNDGMGAIFISPPHYEEAFNHYAVDIAVPVYTEAPTPKTGGVLVSHFNLGEIDQEFAQLVIGKTGGVALFDQDGFWLQTGMEQNLEDPEVDWLRLMENPQPWQIQPYYGNDSLVAWAEVPSGIQPNQVGWRVVTYLPTEEALSPVTIARWVGLGAAVLVLAGASVVSVVLARLITEPLTELTGVSEQILAGEMDVRAPILGKDEIGTLASTFNNMTERLRDMVVNLEQTVAERTQALARRAVQLETSAVVAREAATIREPQKLLEEVTHLISNRFDYYHTGIFLLDERGEYVVLQAASSMGGQRMLARGHKLQAGKVGVVGYVAGKGEPRLAQDVGADVVYYDNPDMPETRSELALPLKVREQVIGVLDVQSKEVNAFSRDDEQALQILADQIALAIENTRLFQSSQQALEELEYLYGQQVAKSWHQRLTAERIGYRYTPAGTDPVTTTETTEAQAPDLSPDGERIVREISFRGQVIGKLDLRREGGQGAWSDEELAVVEEVVEQTALALENARLMEQIRLRSDQIQLLQDVTATAASYLDEQALLTAVAEKLLEGFDLLHCSAISFDEGKKSGTFVANSSRPDAPQIDILGTSIDLENNEVALEVIRTKRPTVLYDVQNNPRALPFLELLKARGTYSMAIMPLIVRNNVIGAMGMDFTEPERVLGEDDLALIEQISAQIAAALEVARLFGAEQQAREAAARRAEREHLVADITAKVRASNDPQDILQTAVHELRKALKADRAQVLLQPDENGRQAESTISAHGEGGDTETPDPEDHEAKAQP